MILMIYMGTVREMAAVAADPVVALALVRNPSPLLHAILVLILLLAATLLAIYKPFGMTPYGTRQQVRARDDNQELVPTSVQWTAGKLRRREYLLWIAGLAILALIIVSHLLGSARHGHEGRTSP